MLNKQGFFNRGNDTARPLNPSSTSPINKSVSPSVSPSVTPGHLAAMESATSTTATVTEPKSNAVSNATPDAVPNAEAISGSRLIVGPDVKLKGAEILDCDTLVVEGRVEATMDSRVIQIAINGSFSGKVGIDVAEIYGQFDGELTARSQLIIHASGRVSGKIRYGKILIEEGGELSGDIAGLASDNSKPSANLRNVIAKHEAAAS
ncbi:MAG: polymer-forming cytoskeletal protein [Methylophilaceae bacterium]